MRDRMLAKAKLVVVRLLGGKAYWDYGVETLYARALEHGIKLAFLPGDDKPDPVLARLFHLAGRSCAALWHYLLEGGPENSPCVSALLPAS